MAEHEKAINALVYRAVAEHGGSISAEHGIGTLKRDALQQYKPPVALSLMRSIKQALDPQRSAQPGPLALSARPALRTARYCSGPLTAGGNGSAITSMPSSRSASASSLVARPRIARSATSP